MIPSCWWMRLRRSVEEVLPGMRARHSACDIQTRVLAQCPAFEDSNNPVLSLVQSLTRNEVTRKVAYTAEAGQYQGAGFPTVLWSRLH